MHSRMVITMRRKIAVILAGGSGQRMGGAVPKQFMDIAGIPMIIRTASAFADAGDIDHLIFVIPDGQQQHMSDLARRTILNIPYDVITGGASRQESSYRAITATLGYHDDDIIIMHDAARPFITPKVIQAAIAAAEEHGAAGVYVPVVDTISIIEDDLVTAIPDRQTMFITQTPQVFRYSIIRNAHEYCRKMALNVTDDISMILAAGYQVHAVPGDYGNIKITTNDDYQFASWKSDRM